MIRERGSKVYAYIRMRGSLEPELWLAVRHVCEPGGLLEALVRVSFVVDDAECSFSVKERGTRTADRTERTGNRVLSTTWYSFLLDDCAQAMIQNLTTQTKAQVRLEAAGDHATRALDSSELRGLADVYASWMVLGGAA